MVTKTKADISKVIFSYSADLLDTKELLDYLIKVPTKLFDNVHYELKEVKEVKSPHDYFQHLIVKGFFSYTGEEGHGSRTGAPTMDFEGINEPHESSRRIKPVDVRGLVIQGIQFGKLTEGHSSYGRIGSEFSEIEGKNEG